MRRGGHAWGLPVLPGRVERHKESHRINRLPGRRTSNKACNRCGRGGGGGDAHGGRGGGGVDAHGERGKFANLSIFFGYFCDKISKFVKCFANFSTIFAKYAKYAITF